MICSESGALEGSLDDDFMRMAVPDPRSPLTPAGLTPAVTLVEVVGERRLEGCLRP